MGNFVTQGAVLQCSFGLSPCTLVITVPSRPKCMNLLMAVTTDFTVTNIPSFGMCHRYGCADTDALCASNLSSLVTRQFSGKGRWCACSDRQQQVYVLLYG